MKSGVDEYMVEPLYEQPPASWDSTQAEMQLRDATKTVRQHYMANDTLTQQEEDTKILQDELGGKTQPFRSCWCHAHFRDTGTDPVWYNRVQLREVAAAVGSGELHAFARANTLHNHEKHMFPPTRQPTEPATKPRPLRSQGVTGAPSLVTGAPTRVFRAPSGVSRAPSGVSGVLSGVSGAPIGVSGAPIGVTGAPVSRAPSGVSGVPVRAVPSALTGAPRSRYLQRFHS
jgi:hypothetical protein